MIFRFYGESKESQASLYIQLASWGGLLLLIMGAAIGLRFLTVGVESEENKCEYTYTSPLYILMDEAKNQTNGSLPKKYRLFLYVEQTYREQFPLSVSIEDD